jgi:hypothetical protein
MTKAKIKTKITVDGVVITLTDAQFAEIKRQKEGIQSSSQVDSYSDACEVLGEDILSDPSAKDVLKTIIRAVNFLDNGRKEYKPNFNDRTTIKHINWFEKTTSGWVAYGVGDLGYSAICPLWLFLKEEKTAKMLSEKFLPQYVKYIEQD